MFVFRAARALALGLVLTNLAASPTSAEYLAPVNASEIDKITISGPTSIQAGKYVTYRLKTNKSVNSNCFLNPDSKGFAGIEFYFAGKNKTIKLLPIQPGAGSISIECRTPSQTRYGFFQLYIKR